MEVTAILALINGLVTVAEKAPTIYTEIKAAFASEDPVATLTALHDRIKAETYQNLVPHTDLTPEQLNS